MTKKHAIQICIALITALAVYIGGVLSSEMVNPLLTLSKAEARYLTQKSAEKTYVTIADFNIIKTEIKETKSMVRDIWSDKFGKKERRETTLPAVAKQ